LRRTDIAEPLNFHARNYAPTTTMQIARRHPTQTVFDQTFATKTILPATPKEHFVLPRGLQSPLIFPKKIPSLERRVM
jgi:hypothetical protein